MTIAIIDYGSGNLRSVAKAFEKVAIDMPIIVSSDPAVIETATHLVLPGVGAFGECVAGLVAIPGMRAAMETAVFTRKIPFLGICVGMQMLMETGYEHGTHEGLGWIKGTCVPLSAGNDNASPLKIPHMGWNDLHLTHPTHPLLPGISEGEHAYFVHSFHVLPDDTETVIATVDYGGPVVAAVAKGNIMGTQFHPEKSQATGLKLIENFLRLP